MASTPQAAKSTPTPASSPPPSGKPSKPSSGPAFDQALKSAAPANDPGSPPAPSKEATPAPATTGEKPTPDGGGNAPTAAPAPKPLPEAPAKAEAGPVEIPQERKAELDEWFDADRDAGPFGLLNRDVNGDDVAGALAGKSDLGSLGADEQRYLTQRALDTWAPNEGAAMAPGQAFELHGLALKVGEQGSPETQRIVAEAFVARADGLLSRPYPEGQPYSGAHDKGDLLANYGMAAVRDGGARSELIGRLSPETASRLGASLGRLGSAGYGRGDDGPLLKTLESATGQASSPQAQALIDGAFASTTAHGYAVVDGLDRAMGDALAAVWHPSDSAARSAEAERFGGILATDQGRELLAAGGDAPPISRVQALATLRANPEITGETLARDGADGWLNGEVGKAMAAPLAEQYLEMRGDEPLTLRGAQLDNTVGMAMNMPVDGVPANETPAQTAAREQAVAKGEFSYYASGPNAEAVSKVVKGIRDVGGETPRVTVLPIQYTHESTGPVQLPLFRVDGADGQSRFVDNTGRTFESFEDWKTSNELPEGLMVYPKDGHLTAGETGKVELESGATPETPDTPGEHVVNALDTAALVGGLAAGGLILIGSGGTAAPLVLGAAGLWQAGRATVELHDRAQHGQSINPFADGEAAALWLNLGAGALGGGAAINGVRLTGLASSGRAISPLAASTTAALNVGANLADAGAMAQTGYSLIANWEQLTPAQRAQMGLSMAFWGVSSAATTRMAGGRTAGDFVDMTFNPAEMRRTLLETYKPVVRSDSSLPGNAVTIDYDVQNGRVGGLKVRHGEDARQSDIDLHVAMGQQILKSDSLGGRIDALFRRHGAPPVGSRAWELDWEIQKLNDVVDVQRRQLDNPVLSAGEKAQIRADIAGYDGLIAQHRKSLEGLESNWSQGLREIDAPSAGRVFAEQNGLPIPPREGYHWVLQPGSDVPVIRADPGGEHKPRLAWDSATNAAVEVGSDPIPARYADASPGTFTLSPNQQRVYVDDLSARGRDISRRNELIALKESGEARLTPQQEAELSRLRHSINESSRKIGETGAAQYVQATYPGAELVYGGPNATSSSGDFDQIWRVPGPDGDRFVVVEAKGGSAGLGTRQIGNKIYSQGTKAYFEDIKSSMTHSGHRMLMDEIENARLSEGLTYLKVKTPIQAGQDGRAIVSQVQVREFKLGDDQ